MLNHAMSPRGHGTISTGCSQGVTCDAREHYRTKFTILGVTDPKTVHFGPNMPIDRKITQLLT
jgi:hypothetical protein